MLKNITLSADESLISRAREKAKNEKKSLNLAFREWLERYTRKNTLSSDYHRLMENMSYAQPGKKFSRDEMNER